MVIFHFATLFFMCCVFVVRRVMCCLTFLCCINNWHFVCCVCTVLIVNNSIIIWYVANFFYYFTVLQDLSMIEVFVSSAVLRPWHTDEDLCQRYGYLHLYNSTVCSALKWNASLHVWDNPIPCCPFRWRTWKDAALDTTELSQAVPYRLKCLPSLARKRCLWYNVCEISSSRLRNTGRNRVPWYCWPARTGTPDICIRSR